MSDHIEVTPDLLAGFLDEAPAYLTALEEGLLAFEAQAKDGAIELRSAEDDERMNEVFRAAHSLKGISASLGFQKIRDVTHLMESLFDQLRNRQRTLGGADVEALFSTVDTLRKLVDELSSGTEQNTPIEHATGVLESILSQKGAASAASAAVPQSAGATVNASSGSGPAASDAAALATADPELLQRYVESTLETIDELNISLLKLESSPSDSETINTIFRCAHNIKGASGAVRCESLQRLTHDMETALDRLRSGAIAVESAFMNALFCGVDHLRSGVTAIREGRFEALSNAGFDDLFAHWIGQRQPPAPAPAEPVAAHQDDATDAVAIHVRFPKGYAEAPIQACILYNRLADLGAVVSSDPDVFSLGNDSNVDRVTFRLRTDSDAAKIERIVRAYPVESVDVVMPERPEAAGASQSDPQTAATAVPCEASATPTAAPARRADADAPREGGGGGAKAGETLRVDLERLDQLMNLGGELVITKARFAQMSRKLSTLFSHRNLGYLVDDISDRLAQLRTEIGTLQNCPSDARVTGELADSALHLCADFDTVRGLVRRVQQLRPVMNEFSEAVHSLNRISEGMQKRIMQTRMVPIGPLFQRFKRVVRDICKATGKKVDLVLRGEATELDKRMIDELVDPLTHMVRNSVDHGVESPEQRRAAGKPEVGQVILDAYHRGRHICVEIRDDGKGINVAAVKKKLVERGLVNAAQVEQMSDSEAIQFIFQPGVSTAEKVTDLSGRGMGMDIVKTRIDALGGAVELSSQPGLGATVQIHLPLTLAIINAMMTRIGECAYALPLETVTEILTVSRDQIQHVSKQAVIRVRDRVVPLTLLEQLVRPVHQTQYTASRGEARLTVMILGIKNDRLGLVVDELIGQEDIVIKDVAANYRNVDGIAGASIMGDGTVALILDVSELIRNSAKRGVGAMQNEECELQKAEGAAPNVEPMAASTVS
ncbi:MAG: chemotaxis protein CheA [Phycisphaerae bacterium]